MLDISPERFAEGPLGGFHRRNRWMTFQKINSWRIFRTELLEDFPVEIIGVGILQRFRFLETFEKTIYI